MKTFEVNVKQNVAFGDDLSEKTTVYAVRFTDGDLLLFCLDVARDFYGVAPHEYEVMAKVVISHPFLMLGSSDEIEAMFRQKAADVLENEGLTVENDYGYTFWK